MTNDEIIEMARQAGAEIFGHPDFATICVNGQDAHDFVEAFAKLVAEREREKLRNIAFFDMWYQEMNAAVLAEREACAKVVENHALGYAEPTWAFKLIDAIRARGQA